MFIITDSIYKWIFDKTLGDLRFVFDLSTLTIQGSLDNGASELAWPIDIDVLKTLSAQCILLAHCTNDVYGNFTQAVQNLEYVQLVDNKLYCLDGTEAPVNISCFLIMCKADDELIVFVNENIVKVENSNKDVTILTSYLSYDTDIIFNIANATSVEITALLPISVTVQDRSTTETISYTQTGNVVNVTGQGCVYIYLKNTNLLLNYFMVMQ